MCFRNSNRKMSNHAYIPSHSHLESRPEMAKRHSPQPIPILHSNIINHDLPSPYLPPNSHLSCPHLAHTCQRRSCHHRPRVPQRWEGSMCPQRRRRRRKSDDGEVDGKGGKAVIGMGRVMGIKMGRSVMSKTARLGARYEG